MYANTRISATGGGRTDLEHRATLAQGHWDEEEYLALDTNHLIEFSHGHLEVVPMPTLSHQRIVLFLVQVLSRFVKSRRLGEALTSPLRVQLWSGKFREPDVVFMLASHRDRKTEQYFIGADLVMEVVSPKDRRHDTETKRREYAQAGIPEYWIVDQERAEILVLMLAGDRYAEHGRFTPGQQATSVLLQGFAVDVAEVFAAAEG
ncbi:MAG: Uma2 family endonuclease [Caldilineales bacterium]|nr:Uma2 family endonuclease [Caldilineales bacterium]